MQTSAGLQHIHVILSVCMHFDGEFDAWYDNLTMLQGNGSGGLVFHLESNLSLPTHWSAGAFVAAAALVQVRQPSRAVIDAGRGISLFQRLYAWVAWRPNFDPCFLV